jgi:hypothetical protein
MNVKNLFSDLLRDDWIGRNLRRELISGPGTICLACSLGTALIGIAFNLIYFGSPGLGPLLFLAAALVAGLLALFVDLYDCRDNHCLILLRRIALRSIDKMDQLHVKSETISEFAHFLSSDRDLEHRFRTIPCESISIIVEAIDRLTSSALRYGCVGKYMFQANEHQIIQSIRLLRSLPTDIADDVLLLPLFVWLDDMPSYDPEGWSLVHRHPGRKAAASGYLANLRRA